VRTATAVSFFLKYFCKDFLFLSEKYRRVTSILTKVQMRTGPVSDNGPVATTLEQLINASRVSSSSQGRCDDQSCTAHGAVGISVQKVDTEGSLRPVSPLILSLRKDVSQLGQVLADCQRVYQQAQERLRVAEAEAEAEAKAEAEASALVVDDQPEKSVSGRVTLRDLLLKLQEVERFADDLSTEGP
jgi:hypothetical protein